ncbi:MAG: hypothetical protein KME55_31545 [Nostoc indistinguendum CM1-VF10]|nr:hypothetical protein [Nostoc indistinguendum CM1-VF10]
MSSNHVNTQNRKLQFQKFTISITLATLAVFAQQHAATANPPSASHASTKL